MFLRRARRVLLETDVPRQTVPNGVTANGVVKPKKITISTPLPNPSLQVTADHNLKQVEAPVYAPGIGEVLLHIKATGVCGYVKIGLNVYSGADVLIDTASDRTFISGDMAG
jgi:hypothetical protein